MRPWRGGWGRGRGEGAEAGRRVRDVQGGARQETRITEHDSEGLARPGEPAAGVALAEACGEETEDGQERCAAGMTGRSVTRRVLARVIAR